MIHTVSNGPMQICTNDQNEIHRTDGPAVIWANGSQEWFENGKCHRTDGLPAVIYADGGQAWYHNGWRHRTDAPAEIHADGTQHWYRNGRHHRTDGPAVIYADGTQHWYINGRGISKKVRKWMKTQNVTRPWEPSTQILFTLTFVCN